MPYIPTIVVVGSINVDLVVTVGQFPAPGETLLGSGFRQVGGGKGANQAVAAARLGSPVALVARVGDDTFGKTAVAALEAEGIDCRFVLPTPGAPTGVAAITVQESTGENNIVVVPGANGLLSAADVENAWELLQRADCIILSLEVPMDAIEAAIRIAGETHAMVVLNPAPAQPLSDELLSQVNLLLPNETEAAVLSGISDLETATCNLSQKLAESSMTIVTRGGSGVLCCSRQGGEPYAVPAFPVDVADTVGAGDCFTAALTVHYHETFDNHKALRFALAAAALAVTKPGAQDAMPRRAEVDAFLRQAGVDQ